MNLTPKEKAQELFYKMLKHSFSDENVSALHRAKQCALIAVDEIISSRNDDTAFDDTLYTQIRCYYNSHPMYLTYWKEVKKEIINLQN